MKVYKRWCCTKEHSSASNLSAHLPRMLDSESLVSGFCALPGTHIAGEQKDQE
jgi:hypothetical protein